MHFQIPYRVFWRKRQQRPPEFQLHFTRLFPALSCRDTNICWAFSALTSRSGSLLTTYNASVLLFIKFTFSLYTRLAESTARESKMTSGKNSTEFGIHCFSKFFFFISLVLPESSHREAHVRVYIQISDCNCIRITAATQYHRSETFLRKSGVV